MTTLDSRIVVPSGSGRWRLCFCRVPFLLFWLARFVACCTVGVECVDSLLYNICDTLNWGSDFWCKDDFLSWFKGEFLLSEKFGSHFIISYPTDNEVDGSARLLCLQIHKLMLSARVLLRNDQNPVQPLGYDYSTGICNKSHCVLARNIRPTFAKHLFSSFLMTVIYSRLQCGNLYVFWFLHKTGAISKFDQPFFQTFQLFFATPSVKSKRSGGGMLCAICVSWSSLQWKNRLCQFGLTKFSAQILLWEVNNL